jgi:hypothetical protein
MDSTAGGVLGIFGFIISAAGAIYAAVNHKRIRCKCCGKDVDVSVDVDSTVPVKKKHKEKEPEAETDAETESEESIEETVEKRYSGAKVTPYIEA